MPLPSAQIATLNTSPKAHKGVQPINETTAKMMSAGISSFDIKADNTNSAQVFAKPTPLTNKLG